MKIFKIIILVLILALLGATGYIYYSYKTGALQKAVVNQVSKKVVHTEKDINLLQKILGVEKTQTYLVLFLNNTELRPGGGFIGAYAVIKAKDGVPKILKVEGTEIIDNLAPRDFISEPPAPLKEYLKVDRWFFRDSNWSPDFSLSAVNALDLYKKERGLEAENITGVIAFTPTVVEEILKIHGPIKINNEEYSTTNFTEKLEYEVEYNFANKGIDYSQRKQALYDLSHKLFLSLGADLLVHWQNYYRLAERMFMEKQLLVYSLDKDLQAVAQSKGWSGEIRGYVGDYLLWADANLGALKTDFSIARNLTYQIRKDANGKYIATAKMKYLHQGKFDWRTTRYRTYARVFVPVGAELLKTTGAMKTDKSKEEGRVDSGLEKDKQWFGAFISIEPGTTGELSFSYYLPSSISALIEKKEYKLLAQKQVGSNNTLLTLDMDFATNIVSVAPAEDTKNLGDQKYNYITNFNADKEFFLKFR